MLSMTTSPISQACSPSWTCMFNLQLFYRCKTQAGREGVKVEDLTAILLGREHGTDHGHERPDALHRRGEVPHQIRQVDVVHRSLNGPSGRPRSIDRCRTSTN